MVKRIKKRIPKQDADGEFEGDDLAEDVDDPSRADGDGGAFDDDNVAGEAPNIRAQLEDMADDTFTRKTASVFGWIIEKKSLLIGVGVVLVVGVGIYMFTQRSQTAAAEEAAAAFQVGADPYVEASRTDDADKRTADIAKAAGAFETARSQYKDRRISALATLGLAGASFDQGKAAEAETLYGEFLARPDTDPFAKAIALQGKAVALEQKGDLPGAVEAWKAMETQDRDAFGLIANVQVGRLLEAQGKGDAAKAHYTKVQADYAKSLEDLPNRSMKAQIERRLTALSGGPT